MITIQIIIQNGNLKLLTLMVGPTIAEKKRDKADAEKFVRHAVCEMGH